MYFHKLLGGIITVILIISVYEIFVSVYEIFELFYIESNENLADVFTKALPVPAHRGLALRLLGGHATL
jgi:hypothetical protein